MKAILIILFAGLMAATAALADAPSNSRSYAYHQRHLRKIEQKRHAAQHKIHKKHCGRW